MVNIFAPTPNMKPSVLNSTAVAATAIAKPVIGTSVPAPANYPILLNSFSAVNNAAKNIKVTGTSIFIALFPAPISA